MASLHIAQMYEYIRMDIGATWLDSQGGHIVIDNLRGNVGMSGTVALIPKIMSIPLGLRAIEALGRYATVQSRDNTMIPH